LSSKEKPLGKICFKTNYSLAGLYNQIKSEFSELLSERKTPYIRFLKI